MMILQLRKGLSLVSDQMPRLHFCQKMPRVLLFHFKSVQRVQKYAYYEKQSLCVKVGSARNSLNKK